MAHTLLSTVSKTFAAHRPPATETFYRIAEEDGRTARLTYRNPTGLYRTKGGARQALNRANVFLRPRLRIEEVTVTVNPDSPGVADREVPMATDRLRTVDVVTRKGTIRIFDTGGVEYL